LKLPNVFRILAAITVVVVVSCASTPPASAPAAAPAAGAAVPKDYLGENTKLVGIRLFSYQQDLFGVPFYVAEVLTPPSPSTKNEGLVKPTGKVADSSESQFWTPYIASSRPATKDELKPGMLVFAVGDAQPRSRSDLAKTTPWGLFRVKDISALYKGTVTLEYHYTYGGSTWPTREYHVDNIRVVVGEFSTELAR